VIIAHKIFDQGQLSTSIKLLVLLKLSLKNKQIYALTALKLCFY